MKTLILRILALLTLLSLQVTAADQTGTFSFLLLKEGKPLANAEVVIDQESTPLFTDSDGYVGKTLPVGDHTLQVIGRENGQAIVYARKPFTIVPDQNTQLIMTLEATNTVGLSDLETPEAPAAVMDEEALKNAPKGTLSIKLLASEENTPIKDARVFVRGTTIEGRSDENGTIRLELPEGTHTLSVIHGQFSSQTLNDIEITAAQTTERTIEMTPAALELEEFVVLIPHIEGSVASVVAEQRESEAIANIIGSAQMSRQGDSNAASALKRVPGITIIGGKYIYVRGLGDRYSSTELNGLPLPSPNPIKRTVPLDMFPAGVIGSLQVQKTFTPDIIGAFGGGYVNVRTKQKVDDHYVKFTVGTSMHSTTGQEVTDYAGSDSDWSGSDDGYRAFSNGFINSVTPKVGEDKPSLDYSDEEIRQMILSRDIDKKATTVPMGGSAQLEIGRKYHFDGGHTVSFLANYGYKTESSAREYTSYDYLISSSGQQSDTPDNTAVNTAFRTTYQQGGTLNLGYMYENFNISYTKLYVLNTLDQTRDIQGTFGENNSNEKHVYFEWQERELDIDQLFGGVGYDLFTDHQFDFGIETASATEYVPNDVYYNYKKYFSSLPHVFDRPDSVLTYNNRTTDDSVDSFYLKNRSMVPLLSDEDYIEIGYTEESKEREGTRIELTVDSDLDDYDFMSGPINDIIAYDDGSHLSYSLTSQPKDQYNAELERSALYFRSLIKPMDNLDITFGLRNVDLKETIRQYGIKDNVVVQTTNGLSFQKSLPSLAAKYVIDDSNQIRFAYSETFIYPDFREFVNTEFIHPVFLAKVAGNPDLVETDIQSYDLRYEYYFDQTDNITFALFYKHMDNPIEDTQTYTTSTLDRFSFENSQAADLSGLEFSWYKNMQFVADMLENVTFSGNYTYISSDVTLTPEQQDKFVTQDRGLQGLSPQTINLSVTYSEPDTRSVNLSFNKMSERLMRVALKNGDVIFDLDDYEVPPELLDFTWNEKFHPGDFMQDLTLSFKIKNLLDSETVWKKEDGQVVLEYKTGTSYSLSLSGKF